MKIGLATWVCALGVVATNAHAGEPPGFWGIGFLPGGEWSSAADVSADGRVVIGTAQVRSDAWEAGTVRWTGAHGLELLSLPLPSPRYDFGTCVSADGEVIVGILDRGSERTGYRWSNAIGFEELDHLPGINIETIGAAVSFDGTVVAGASLVQSEDGTTRYQACQWTADGLSPIGHASSAANWSVATGVSADGKVIVGAANDLDDDGFGNRSFGPYRWTLESGIVGLGWLRPDHRFGHAFAISSNRLVIVGSTWSERDDEEGFRWTANDGMISLGAPPVGVRGVRPYDISSDRAVITGFWSVVIDEHTVNNGSFLWTTDRGLCEFQQAIRDECLPGVSGWSDILVTAVADDSRTFVGQARNPQGLEEGWVARLPSLISLACDGDADRNERVNFDDVLSVLANYGNICRAGAGAPGDADLDGTVAFDDMLEVIVNFGAECE